MDRFITHEGQMPIWLGDIDYMTGIFRDTVKRIVAGLGLDSRTFILSGFNISSSFEDSQLVLAWDEGAVVIDGEIYRIDAGKLSVSSTSGPMQSPAGLKIAIGYDSLGQRQLKSGETKDCWQTRRAVVAAYNYDVPLRGLRRFEDILSDRVTGSLPPFREEFLIRERGIVRFDSGSTAGVGQVGIVSVSGALYLSFEISMLMRRVDDKVSKFFDYDVTCRSVGETAKIVDSLKGETAAFSLPVMKTDAEDRSIPSSILCTVTISKSPSSVAAIHVTIVPSEPVEDKIRGNCFIRLGYGHENY